MKEDPIAGYFDTIKPQYKASGGAVDFSALNNIDWTQFDPTSGTFNNAPIAQQEGVPQVQQAAVPQPQQGSVGQPEVKTQGFRYQAGKTPFETVQPGVVQPENPREIPRDSPYSPVPYGGTALPNFGLPSGGK